MKKINAWFINPWITDFTAYDLWSKPLGLLYLVSFLRNQPLNPFFLDMTDRFHPEMTTRFGYPKVKKNGTGPFYSMKIDKPAVLKPFPRYFRQYGMPQEVIEKIISRWPKPDIIFITSLMTYWYPGVFRTANLLKEKFPGIPIVLGGIYATLLPAHAASTGLFDEIVQGAGESESIKILKQYFPETGFFDFSLNSMDDFPWPAFDLYHHVPYYVTMTSRGCPYNCTFCASNLVAPEFIQRPYEKVAEEIISQSHQLGVRDIAFYDDALLMNRDKLFKPLMERLLQKSNKLRFHTPNGLHGKMIDRETAELMVKNHFQTVRISYEYFSPEKKKDISYKISNEEFIETINILETAGFARKMVEAYIIIGLPSQSVGEILESMLFVHSQGVQIRLASFSPIPGTTDFIRAVRENKIDEGIDPLLCNKTIFPLQKNQFSYETYHQIRQLNHVLNEASLREINLVKNHYWNSEFLEALVNVRTYLGENGDG